MTVSSSAAPTADGGSGVGVAELTEDELSAGIVDRFRTVVTAMPDRLAVTDEHEELSYAQLAARAARVLAAVRGADLPAGQPVGMLAGHDVGAVAALLGVLASGHPVLVLDPRSPAPRLRTLVERAALSLVVTDAAHETLAADLADRVVVPLRDAARDAARDDDDAPTQLLWQDPPEPTAIAALAFTSGSTGTPKPVANDHVLLMRDAWNSSIATGCYDSHGVIAHTLPIAFHAGLTTTIHGLVVGARMRLYDSRSRGIAGLPAFIGEHGCTVMITSPAILRALCASGPDPAHLASLTSVTIAGETAYGRDVEALRPLLPAGCVLRNRYGSSETGLISEYVVGRDVAALDGPLPVGRGVGRTVIDLVATTSGGGIELSVEPGATGRITVTAPRVALGYYEMPEETQRSFRDNGDGTFTYRTSDLGRFLPDGSMQIVGRADHSVKVRGYLVDPGEVDAALFALPHVREAVVVGVPRATGGTRLIAYIVADRGVEAGAIRAALRRALPSHMVPEGMVFLDALPRSERGKIDRAALPEPPAAARVEEDGSMSHFEQLVAMIWAKVLDVDHVGHDDDFFALGGDSLATEELMTRISEELNIPAERVHTGLLAQAPVLRDFAVRLADGDAAPNGALVPLQESGSAEPLFVVAGAGGLGIAFVGLSRRLGPDRPAYALQSPVIESRGWPERSVEAMARAHVARIRTIQPHGPYYLAGHSFGGIIAFEMAHQFKALGEEVALLAILDSFPPDPAAHPEPDHVGVLGRMKRLAGLHYTTLRNTPGGSGHGRLFDQSKKLAGRYRGRPWDGDTLVFLAQSPEKEQRAPWGPYLSGRWRTVEVTGDHYTMIRTPWVHEVADVLSTHMGSAPTPAAPAS